MVGVGPNGDRSSLARVAVVNEHGNVLLDVFVKQKEKVTDYRHVCVTLVNATACASAPFLQSAPFHVWDVPLLQSVHMVCGTHGFVPTKQPVLRLADTHFALPDTAPMKRIPSLRSLEWSCGGQTVATKPTPSPQCTCIPAVYMHPRSVYAVYSIPAVYSAESYGMK